MRPEAIVSRLYLKAHAALLKAFQAHEVEYETLRRLAEHPERPGGERLGDLG